MSGPTFHSAGCARDPRPERAISTSLLPTPGRASSRAGGPLGGQAPEMRLVPVGEGST